MSIVDVAIKNIQEKWQRITGRDPEFVAPETSSTLSIALALKDLDTRLQRVEAIVLYDEGSNG